MGNHYYGQAREWLADLAASVGAEYDRDLGGEWSRARCADGRTLDLVSLCCPRAVVVMEGIGRFELDLATQEDQVWKCAARSYMGDPRVGGMSVHENRGSVTLGGTQGDDRWTLEGSSSFESVAIDGGFIELAHFVAGKAEHIAVHSVSIANRVVIGDSHGASLAFDFLNSRVAQWSLDPVWGPQLELDVVSQRRTVTEMLDAFASGTWSIVETVGRAGVRRLSVEFASGGRAWRVSIAAPLDAGCRACVRYPWVRWG